MSFSAEQFINRLNTLEDSQESISNGAKWLLSQYKYVDDIIDTWEDYMLNRNINTRRKLMSVYLINHVVQEAKPKKIVNFYGNDKFGTVVIRVVNQIYTTLPSDLKRKLSRVLKIWRDRKIFSTKVLETIDAEILNGSDSQSNSNKTSSSRSKSTSEKSKSSIESLIPPNLKELISKETEILKSVQSINASYLRFKDTSTRKNYNSLSNIGASTKSLIENNLTLRSLKKEILNKLLAENDRLIEDEQNLLGEVEMILHSNSNVNDLTSNTINNDILPTYEDDKSDSDSDSDNDDNSDGSNNKDENVIQESDQNAVKRTNDLVELESELLKNKRARTSDGSNEIVNAADHEEYDVVNNDNENNEDSAVDFNDSNNNNNDSAVTSSIQDLLSKLAN